MILIRAIYFLLVLFFAAFSMSYTFADTHDTNASAEVSEEEALPLNDPFAGNAASSEILTDDTANEPGSGSILYDYKLVGIISGSLQSYISLVDAGGDVLTLTMFDELSDGLRLVDMNRKEAVFQKSDGKYLIINSVSYTHLTLPTKRIV